MRNRETYQILVSETCKLRRIPNVARRNRKSRQRISRAIFFLLQGYL